uniref:Helicase C-terminal domain-containing protein n=1 Tax=Macrostomum lignano TaxID=282301 RepID=A0A1I8FR52_9PLAT
YLWWLYRSAPRPHAGVSARQQRQRGQPAATVLTLASALSLNCRPLHSDMQQRQRLKSLDRFFANPDSVLLATDVAALRGLDIPLPSGARGCTIRCPKVSELYLHRCGRTARASRSGTAVALVSPEEAGPLRRLLRDSAAAAMATSTTPAKSDNLAGDVGAAQPRAAGPGSGRPTLNGCGSNGTAQELELDPDLPELVDRRADDEGVELSQSPAKLDKPTRKWLDSARCSRLNQLLNELDSTNNNSFQFCCGAAATAAGGLPRRQLSRARNGRARQQLLAAVEQHCSNSPCPAGPLSRQFRQLIPSDSVMQSGQFRVLHWNILPPGAHRRRSGSHFDRILYNTHRFECLQSETGLLIEPNEDGTEFLDAPSGAGSQVFVLLRLRLLNPPATDDSDGGGELWVAATHLKAKVTFSNLRLLQTKALITALKERVPANSPLLLCGDFNGESFEPFYNVIVQSGLDIASAYKQPEEPPFTTFKYVGKSAEPQARGIDYIWYRAPATASPAGDSA